MKGKLMGFLVTFLIIMVAVAFSWRIPFVKKLVYGA